MAARREPMWLTEDVADFLATCPDREQLLKYRPTPRTQERVSDLLHKLKTGRITAEEQRELDQFEHVEMLMQMVKARLRARKVS
jgi:hypothetical protein